VPQGQVGDQRTGTADGDEDTTAEADQLFEEACRQRRADTRMRQGDRDLSLQEVHVVGTDLGAQRGQRASPVFTHDLLDHVLEVTQHDPARHLPRHSVRPDDRGDVDGLDDRLACRVELEDRGVVWMRSWLRIACHQQIVHASAAGDPGDFT
jgi:hypothetical protein